MAVPQDKSRLQTGIHQSKGTILPHRNTYRQHFRKFRDHQHKIQDRSHKEHSQDTWADQHSHHNKPDWGYYGNTN